jgi:tetratricopeptide (TPR) repeat protein
VHREQVASWGKRAGNDDPQTLYALRELGITLEYGGKWSEAETVHREALASWRKRAGNDDAQTLYTLDRLGWTLEGEGKWSEAESVYREALMSRRKRAVIDDPQVLSECEQLCRVLREQRKYHDMEQFLAEVLTPEFLKLPACCTLVARRLDLMGRQGKWSEAADATATLMQYQPAEYFWAYNMAALSAKAHDGPAYEQLCKRIPAAFIETTNSYIAWRIALGCLLLPNSGADRRLVQQLATKAVTLGSGNSGIGYFQACKALSEYREGGFAQAVEWAERGRTNSEAFASAEACAVLTMAQSRLGLKDAARDTLTQGNRLAPEVSSTRTPDLGDGWLDWLIARILLNEATELIANESTPGAKSKN